MAGKGKQLQVGAGSRRRSQAKAEDAARRSRKRAAERADEYDRAEAALDYTPARGLDHILDVLGGSR